MIGCARHDIVDGRRSAGRVHEGHVEAVRMRNSAPVQMRLSAAVRGREQHAAGCPLIRAISSARVLGPSDGVTANGSLHADQADSAEIAVKARTQLFLRAGSTVQVELRHVERVAVLFRRRSQPVRRSARRPPGRLRTRSVCFQSCVRRSATTRVAHPDCCRRRRDDDQHRFGG